MNEFLFPFFIYLIISRKKITNKLEGVFIIISSADIYGTVVAGRCVD